GGSSYIDSVIFRDRDHNSGWTSAADSTREERRYYCQNWRADVSAILTDDGKLVEWVKYSSYGIPFALPAGDTDSDGEWDATDSGNITISSSYDVRQDANLDGSVNSSDITHANSITGGYQTLGRGTLSSGGIGGAVSNRRGYAGYEYDPTFNGAARQLYHVRHRVYDAEVGRWTRRDPLGYVDGMGLYEYVKGRPIAETDPEGLACTPERCNASTTEWMPTECPTGTTATYADAGRGRRGPGVPIKFIRCPGNAIPPWADGPGIIWELDLLSDTCRGKCKSITIKCTTKCNTAYAERCTVTIGPPCNPGMNRWQYLRHELRHVEQYCLLGRISGCDDRICREVDAYRVAGQCGVNAPPANIGSCCDRACDSVQKDAWCFKSKARCVARCSALWLAGTCNSYPYERVPLKKLPDIRVPPPKPYL
ncbi:MAG: RHS repeat-associated core domain-containing protein, partial [Phycisphaerales bacterium]